MQKVGVRVFMLCISILLVGCGVTANRKAVITVDGHQMVFVTDRPIEITDDGLILSQSYQLLDNGIYEGWYEKVVYATTKKEGYATDNISLWEPNPTFQTAEDYRRVTLYYNERVEVYQVDNEPSYNEAGILFHGSLEPDGQEADLSFSLGDGDKHPYAYLYMKNNDD